jgi:IS5 family transposase
VHADAGYTCAEKRVEDRELTWHVAEKRGKVKAIKHDAMREAVQELETLKARIRAKVEHPFRVVKGQFGYLKVRFRGVAKNTAQVLTLFALSNLFQARRRLLAMTGEVCTQGAGSGGKAGESARKRPETARSESG